MNIVLDYLTIKKEQNIRYFNLTVLAAYFYVFMEWVFFVTKSSFMDYMSMGEKINILFRSGLFASVLAIPLLFIFALLDFIAEKTIRLPMRFSALPASLILGSLGLLLFDNFTYTVFEFGVITSTYAERTFYILFYCGLLYYFYTQAFFYVHPVKKKSKHNADKSVFKFCLALISISVLCTAPELARHHTLQADKGANSGEIRKPNIIMLGSDGVDASHMSVYGYERETTPTIAKLAENSLVAENNFPNAGYTVSSSVSILTGRLPVETRVLYALDILHGQDSYRHLAYLLKQEGYYAAQFGDNRYVNALKWNMLQGFDEVSGKKQYQNQRAWFAALSRQFGDNTNYFVTEMSDRLVTRILHIFIEDTRLSDFYDEAHPGGDANKVKQIINMIKNNKEPFFIQTHLLGTHAPRYQVNNQVFSAGKTQDANFLPEFYDDAILGYDQNVKEIIRVLKATRKMQNTILVIYTDHGANWATDKRIPLIIHFPQAEHAGPIQADTQNLDIAPTILDYMGISQPDWMTGASLLEPVDKHRLIFSSLPIGTQTTSVYQFKAIPIRIRAIECQKWHLFNPQNGTLESGEIHGHTAPCKTEDLQSPDEVFNAMARLLHDNGYDTTSLKLP